MPTASKATLSGQLIGLTLSLGKPAKYVSGASGSPHTSSSVQVKERPVWSPPSSASSSTYPLRLPDAVVSGAPSAGRTVLLASGLASSTG